MTRGSKAVAVLGAGGTMGLPMARNIAAAGLPVRAWNRTAERAHPLKEHGVELADSPEAAAEGASILITLLSDAEAVLETTAGVLPELADGAVWIQMSTVGIEGTERCAELAREAGVELVDAPVLGTKLPAEQGELLVLASGPGSARAACEPVFDAIGRQTMWLGEVGAGTRLKLVVNSWLLSIVEGLAETLALARGTGVDPEDFFETISGGPLDLGYAQLKGRMMLEGDFEPSFKLSLAAKDAGLIQEACDRYGLELPILAAIERRLLEGAAEHGDRDMAATYRTSAPG
jgi:3-hydroxyisobutyrate dehydrogenase